MGMVNTKLLPFTGCLLNSRNGAYRFALPTQLSYDHGYYCRPKFTDEGMKPVSQAGVCVLSRYPPFLSLTVNACCWSILISDSA